MRFEHVKTYVLSSLISVAFIAVTGIFPTYASFSQPEEKPEAGQPDNTPKAPSTPKDAGPKEKEKKKTATGETPGGYEHLRYPFQIFKKLSPRAQEKVWELYEQELNKMKSENKVDKNKAMRKAIKKYQDTSNPDDWGVGEVVL